VNFLLQFTVRTKLIGTFLLITVGAVVGTAIGSYSALLMHRDAEKIYEKALIPINAVGDVMRNVHGARAQLLLGLQHDPRGKWAAMHDHKLDKHLNNYQDALDDARAGVSAYEKRADLSDDEKKMVAGVAAALGSVNEAGKQIVQDFEAENYDHANEIILKQLNPAVDALQDKVAAAELTLISNSKKQNVASEELIKRITLFLWASCGIGVALIWGIYYYLSLNITRPLARVRNLLERIAQGDLTMDIQIRGKTEFSQVLHSVTKMQHSLKEIISEISLCSQAVAKDANVLLTDINDTVGRAQQQRDHIQLTSAALEEMGRSIGEVSSGAAGVREASVNAKNLAAVGAQNMDDNLAAVDKIVEQVRCSSASINDLCDSTKLIAELAGIIRDIADQTNLLALNAAIEAARAGEQGRGFAVVADEVRKLAERTAESSNSIGTLLKKVTGHSALAIEAMQQISADVDHSAEQTRAMGGMLAQILDASNQVSSLSEGIAEATRQQAQASASTGESMERISTLTESNTASIEHVSEGVSEMNSIATRLSHLVARFRVA
jgi:methyl-accepting chemotaxis protein